jgi:hypothetical protein
MNILYIIGNGFDINLGLKTKYSDFYKYYQGQLSEDNLINNLKKEIAKGIVNWADLEEAFGKYMVNLNDREEFDTVYDDIVINLGDYLENQEKEFDFSKVDKSILLKDLSTPELFLTQEDIQELKSYKSNWGAATWNINIITLNYTRALEKILESQISNIQIGKHRHGLVMLGNIQHIHGYTDERTILGVNDISQVGKEQFHTDKEILDALIKPGANRALRHNVDKICENHAHSAHIICIFGSSLGDTDNYWWKLVGDQLRKNTRIIIFMKCEEISQRLGYRSVRSRQAFRELFLSKTDLSDAEKLNLQNNIYIGINTNMFTLI